MGRHVLKYLSMMIPGKLKTEINLSFLDNRSPEYTSTHNAGKTTSVALYPTVMLTLIKPNEIDDNGQRTRGIFNPNDSLFMMRFNVPVFLENLTAIQTDLKIPNMYTYTGKRLELNEAEAAKARKVFKIGQTTLELTAVVIATEDERIEGIKMKFNNEASSVLLTLNELEALIFNLKTMDIDSIGLLMYLNFKEKSNHPTSFDASNIGGITVDITPMIPGVGKDDTDIII